MKTLEPTSLAFFDAAPVRIDAWATLPATPAVVFDALADAAGWLSWFPLMYRASWPGGAGGQGAEREVALHGLGRFRERMIAWEPGARFAFTMIGTTSPFVEQMAEDYRLTAVPSGTRLDWVMAAVPTRVGRAGMPVLKRVGVRVFKTAGKRLAAKLRRR